MFDFEFCPVCFPSVFYFLLDIFAKYYLYLIDVLLIVLPDSPELFLFSLYSFVLLG